MAKEKRFRAIAEATAFLVRNFEHGDRTAKSLSMFLGSNEVVRATWRHRPRKDEKAVSMVVTVGRPNCRERAFVKAGRGKLWLRRYPKKK